MRPTRTRKCFATAGAIAVVQSASHANRPGADPEDFPPALAYRYIVIDVRDTDAEVLLDTGEVLSGLRGLKSLVKEEVKRMPVTIDIHENEFLDEIYQEGEQKGRLANAREMLLEQIDVKFGSVPATFKQRIETGELATLQLWGRRLMKAATLEEIFA